MSEKWRYVLAVVLGCALLAGGQKPTPKPDMPMTPRYQIVTGTSYDKEERVFLLDTIKGRVWEYSPPAEIKSKGATVGFHPQEFSSVGIGKLNQDEATEFRLQNSANETE